ncbi:hypothetical protein DFH06DRAFT_703294 [Mycena polygramma]|nr:hypothetical protein DFH06DRAFT_703294 [Mycena polygramma]
MRTLTLLSLITAIDFAFVPTNVHSYYVRDDIHCPKGSKVGFFHNAYSYNAPLPKFTNITGSFFHIAWYGGSPATNTAGTDNVPGATRSGSWDGGSFNQTLTMYSMHSDALAYTYHGEPFNYAPRNGPHLYFARYIETIRFESICGGKATYIAVLAYLCSDDQVRA